MDELHEKAKYLEVNEEQQQKIDYLRLIFSEIYKSVDAICKPSRETSLAITKLEEAQFWAIKSVTREEKDNG